MLVIPAINCLDFECVQKRLVQIKDLGAEWAHIDISDGRFTPVKTWNEPTAISNLKSQISNLNAEIHLMVERPEEYIKPWVEAGAKRFVVHAEAIDRESLREIMEMVSEETEIGLALRPETEADVLEPYLEDIKFVQLLAVNPGLSGQKFQPRIVDKIGEVRNLPYGDHVTIEIDGGVNLDVARLVKEAGADIVVSASYLWDSVDPKGAYENLRML